jgi:hypothetical protein
LSKNPYATKLLNENKDKINWSSLSCNYNAINLLETNIDKINWFNISSNPSIFEIDYNAIKKRIEPFIEELMMKCYHPDKLYYFLTKYNYDIGSDEYINEEN